MDSKDTIRFRQVHLDYHTSPDIPLIGAAFDPEEFAETLDKAHVNSVTCFARCHHGMLYYDSKLFPERVHPQLQNKDLLKQQLEACHKRGIRVPIYTTVQWDHYTASEHPEWLSRDENGAVNGSPGEIQRPYDAGFYRTLCLNTGYRAFLKAHVRELLELFQPVDGLFFDILFPASCSCESCRRGMAEAGLNPYKAADRQAYAQGVIDDFKMDMTAFVRQFSPTCTIFYNRGHIGVAHKPVMDAYSHFELESLPSGLWGYLHFPVTMRYARTMGKPCIGMTGKFHTQWGDFCSYKNLAALQFECFQMLALNAKCSIGDQLEPKGRLSDAAYDLIGAVYAEVERKEAWCRGAQAVVDFGVLNPEEFSGVTSLITLSHEIQGVTRMLQEGGRQFDIIDSAADFARYKVLVLPDTIPVNDALAQKLAEYIGDGGAVVASFESGLNVRKDRVAFSQLGIRLEQELTTDLDGVPVRGRSFEKADYAEYIRPGAAIRTGLLDTAYVMCSKGLEIYTVGEVEVLGEIHASYFDRTYQHFCSHRSTPCSGKRKQAGIVKNGSVIYFSNPIFTQYYVNAPRWDRQLFLNALDLLLPSPVLRHNGPSTLLTAVNEQAAEKRYVVHLLHYIPERRSAEMDVIEDVIPLYQIELELNLPRHISRVTLVPEEQALEFERVGNKISVTVPKVNGHAMLCLDYS